MFNQHYRNIESKTPLFISNIRDNNVLCDGSLLNPTYDQVFESNICIQSLVNTYIVLANIETKISDLSANRWKLIRFSIICSKSRSMNLRKDLPLPYCKADLNTHSWAFSLARIPLLIFIGVHCRSNYVNLQDEGS